MCKILVADDSSTIQKVISMTLGDQGYTLDSAMSEGDIFTKLTDETSILLLDYGISTAKSGSELAEEVLVKFPHLKIVALLSTFDQIDRATLLELGFAESVTKPFDSASFIEMIQTLIVNSSEDDAEIEDEETEDVSDAEIAEEEEEDQEESVEESDDEVIDASSEESVTEQNDESPEEDDFLSDVDEEADEESFSLSEVEDTSDADMWTVSNDVESGQTSPSEGEKTIESSYVESDSLQSQLEDWGVEVPGVVGSNQSISLLPPKIADSVDQIDDRPEEVEVSNSDEKLPDDNDLEYPDMGSSISESVVDENEIEAEVSEYEDEDEDDLSDLALSSSMISMENLNETPNEELIDDEETDPNIQLSAYEGNLDELVSDETDGDDLWSVDEGLKVESIEPINKESFTHDEHYEEEMVAKLEDGASEVEKLEPHEEHVEQHFLGEEEEPAEVIEPTDEIIDAAVDETIHTAFNSFNRDEFLIEIKEELRQELLGSKELKEEIRGEVMQSILNDEAFKAEIKKSLMDELKAELIKQSQQQIDKVTWEVIPDLAENIIKQEIRKISESL